MAKAYDNSQVTNLGTAQNPSTSYTMGSAPDGVLLALLYNGTDTADTSATGTFNGVALTKVGFKGTSGGGAAVTGFYLEGPASGAHTLAFTTSASKAYQVVIISYTGVQVDNAALNADSGSKVTPMTVNITSTQSGDWGVNIALGNGSTMSASTNINTNRIANGSGFVYAGDSNGSLGAAGTYAVGYQQSPADWWYGGMSVALKTPVVAFIAPPNKFPKQAVIRAATY